MTAVEFDGEVFGVVNLLLLEAASVEVSDLPSEHPRNFHVVCERRQNGFSRVDDAVAAKPQSKIEHAIDGRGQWVFRFFHSNRGGDLELVHCISVDQK